MSSKNITIIIPNLNGRQHLEHCLPSILEQSYQDFEIILVDNGSTDGSVEFVTKKFPRVQILASSYNMGFAKANNVAIQAASAPCVVTLNNDTTVEPNWLSEMMDVVRREPDVGMIACKTLNMHNPHLIDSAGMDIDHVGMAWPRYYGQPDNKQETEPYEVFCPTGAAALYKRELLNQVGLFDEEFFAYCEDMDLGWRARLMGWRCLYVPTSIVYHYHSATSKQGSPFKRYLITRNRIWTVIKNYPADEIWFDLPKLIFYDLVAMVYRLLLERNLSPIWGRLASLSKLKVMLQHRRLIQGKRVLSMF
jgi:hypothetical protein